MVSVPRNSREMCYVLVSQMPIVLSPLACRGLRFAAGLASHFGDPTPPRLRMQPLDLSSRRQICVARASFASSVEGHRSVHCWGPSGDRCAMCLPRLSEVGALSSPASIIPTSLRLNAPRMSISTRCSLCMSFQRRGKSILHLLLGRMLPWDTRITSMGF